jgi:hypothetical protein
MNYQVQVSGISVNTPPIMDPQELGSIVNSVEGAQYEAERANMRLANLLVRLRGTTPTVVGTAESGPAAGAQPRAPLATVIKRIQRAQSEADAMLCEIERFI